MNLWVGPLPVCLAEHHEGKVRRLRLVSATLSHLLTRKFLAYRKGHTFLAEQPLHGLVCEYALDASPTGMASHTRRAADGTLAALATASVLAANVADVPSATNLFGPRLGPGDDDNMAAWDVPPDWLADHGPCWRIGFGFFSADWTYKISLLIRFHLKGSKQFRDDSTRWVLLMHNCDFEMGSEGQPGKQKGS